MISLHLFLVSTLQGQTEFLPISSSAHLIILPTMLAVKDQGIVFDVSVHLGSLFALLIFFKEDTLSLVKGSRNLVVLDLRKKEVRFLLRLIFSCIPVILVGLFFKIHNIDTLLRSIEVIGWTMIIFGVFLYVSDRLGKQNKKIGNWTYKHALLMGCFQVLALVPGVSRSGITISGARILGYTRYESIRLSMLMSIPTIIGSGVLLAPGLFKASYDSSFFEILVAFTLSFLSSFLALTFLIKYIYRFKFTPYIIYRIFLGFLLLWFVYS